MKQVRRLVGRRLVILIAVGQVLLIAGTLLSAGFRNTAAADADLWQMKAGTPAPPPHINPSATGGSVTGQTVFLPDERVSVDDTTQWPFRDVVDLWLFENDSIVATCTGMLTSANSVITAGHCLYDKDHAKFYQVLVVPAENQTVYPYGSTIVTKSAVPVGYGLSNDARYDIGIALLFNNSGYQPSGPYASLASAPDSYFAERAAVLATAGYPGDKALGTQWFTAAYVQYVDPDYIFTTMDAYPGQSGSPIYLVNTERLELLVVGVFNKETAFFNIAVRLSDAMITALKGYCASIGCSFSTATIPNPTIPTPSPTPTPTKTPSPTATPTKTATPHFPRRAVLPQLSGDGVP
jgi:V8-like Glu-specific endopeptidase